MLEIAVSEEWLERIERKIDAQGKEQRRLSAVLDQHTILLNNHTAVLEQHTAQLDQQMTQLVAHGDLLEVQGKELRRIDAVLGKVQVVVEGLQDDVRGVAEGVIALSERMERGFAEVLQKLDDRASPLEAASRHFASKLADHERRLPKRSRRRKH